MEKFKKITDKITKKNLTKINLVLNPARNTKPAQNIKRTTIIDRLPRKTNKIFDEIAPQ